MNSTTFRCAAASLLLSFLQPAAISADPAVLVGARVSCDVPTSSGDADAGSCPGVELSARFVLAPTVSLDGSIGYRRASVRPLASLGPLLHLDAGLRYVVCPIKADSRVHALERYPVALLGLSRVL